MNLQHNINANGRINPGSWTGSAPNVPHAFNNHDIRTIADETLPGDHHTVTFNLHGGTGSFPLTQTVPNNGTATAPTPDPTRSGYTFAGWYTAATGGVRFNFSTPITANTTIHAR